MINRIALDAEITEFRENKSISHRRGTCGGNADLCADCHKHEYAVMLKYASEFPAIGLESHLDYARRVGLPMYDTWYEVAGRMIRA
jgi:hypothetical protein